MERPGDPATEHWQDDSVTQEWQLWCMFMLQVLCLVEWLAQSAILCLSDVASSIADDDKEKSAR